jgi:PadR family transcriptional regulator
MSKPSDLVQGTLDLPLLKILALEPMRGWAAVTLNEKRLTGKGCRAPLVLSCV